jgi:hypothetical protein
MSDKIGSDSTFRDSWLDGAARAFFVTAYADYCDEGHSTDNELADEEREARLALPRATSGADWYDYAPEPPPNAYALAGELWALLERDNKASVYMLAERAKAADGLTDNEEIDAEEFGRDLAMQAMGHGVSWFDDHKKFPLKIPHVDCSMCSFSDDAYTKES